MARRLACQSGAAWDRQQYEMIICCVWPLHRVWEYALTERRLKEWNSVEGRLQLIQDAQVPPVRVFAHGAGGSGKTYCLTKVVMAVFQWFMPGQCRKQASTNSAARLIAGDTMHACAGLLKSAKFTAEEPSRKVQNKLKTTWGTAVFVYNDEVGAAAPGLYGTLSSRAYWGKRAAGQIEDVGPKQAPFGNPLLHVDAGDFAQLRPVPKGSPSLMEAFLMSRKEYANEGRVRPLTDMEMLGLKTFDLVAETCVEFKGTYRFKENDPLIRLLQIMRTVGGAEVPETLRQQILSRIQLGGKDPRAKLFYRFPKSVLGSDVFSDNNFCNGMHSAVNWEQVSRMQQVWAARNARASRGPQALQNSRAGEPQYYWETFCPYLSRAHWRMAPVFEKCLGRLSASRGQLLFLSQRVDRAQAQQHAHDKEPWLFVACNLLFSVSNLFFGWAVAPDDLQALLRSALRHVNMTDTGKLAGLCPLYLGMPVKVTHKLCPPEVVQEATGEILQIGFHEEERYGLPRQLHRPGGMPHKGHPCWSRGWVKLDMVPRWVEIRLHGCTADFTGTGRPGVYLVEPTNADWDLQYQATAIVNHPNEVPKRKKVPRIKVGLRSSQLPIAPAGVGTFNNMQGKTAKDEKSVPMGHTIDLKLLDGNDDKWLHYYMILGRATSLATTLLLNFPEDANGEPDWTIFENGPPEYLIHVFAELEKRYEKTQKLVTLRQADLKIFPSFACLPARHKGLGNEYVYNTAEWDAAVAQRSQKRKPDSSHRNLAERLERRAEEPPRRKRK